MSEDIPLIEQLIFVPVAFDAICPARDANDPIRPSEIAERVAQVQAGWSDKVRSWRAGGVDKKWSVPVVHANLDIKDVIE